jgi:hypothetical protein
MEAQPITLTNLTTKRRAKRPHPRGEGRGTDAFAESSIIDEAFAGYTRVDAPETGAEKVAPWRRTQHELVANIATQLEALERQRAQLARLLQNIDADCV